MDEGKEVIKLGKQDGFLDGIRRGLVVGGNDGYLEGIAVGFILGELNGLFHGCDDGTWLGIIEGQKMMRLLLDNLKTPLKDLL